MSGAGPAVAAIACGTNSTRLLVADAAGAPLHRDLRITRLGEGVDATGELAPDAIERTLAVLRGEPAGVVSVDIGCVRAVEKFLHTDPPTPFELGEALSAVRDCLDDVARHLPAVTEASQLVVLAGPATALATVRRRLVAYGERSHHFLLPRDAVEDLFRTAAGEKRSARVGGSGMEEALADVMVGGVVILLAIVRCLDVDHCLMTEADILDRLVHSLRERR